MAWMGHIAKWWQESPQLFTTLRVGLFSGAAYIRHLLAMHAWLYPLCTRRGKQKDPPESPHACGSYSTPCTAIGVGARAAVI